jgi:hypothetical protein
MLVDPPPLKYGEKPEAEPTNALKRQVFIDDFYRDCIGSDPTVQLEKRLACDNARMTGQ